jgi:hypothetical protein
VVIHGRGAGQPQGHRILRIDLQRLVDQPRRLAGEAAAGIGRGDVCVVGQQLRVALDEGAGAVIGLLRFQRPAHHLVRARQHGPALEVAGFLL